MVVKAIVQATEKHQSWSGSRATTYQPMPVAPNKLEKTRANYLRFIKLVRIGFPFAEQKHLLFLTQWQQELSKLNNKAARVAFVNIMERAIEANKLDLVAQSDFIIATRHVAQHHETFLRPVNEWRLPSSDVKSNVDALVQHCLVQYPVPAFMVAAWTDVRMEAERSWYLTLAAGGNLRSCENLPFSISKKVAHHFMQAPANVSIGGAIRYAQVRAFNGSEELALGIAQSTLQHLSYGNNEFWMPVLQFLSVHGMPVQVGLPNLIAYLANQDARDNGFSISGRSMQRLEMDALAWVAQQRAYHGAGLSWLPSGIALYKAEGRNGEQWFVQELCSSKALADESARMSHCIADYDTEAADGNCVIFSLRKVGPSFQGAKSMATIEVDAHSLGISEAAGNCNSEVTGEIEEHMLAWAKQAGLKTWEPVV